MKKARRFSALALILFLNLAWLAPARPALAETFTGGSLTLSLPKDWNAHYNQENGQIMAVSPGDDCVVGLQFVETNGATVKEIAEGAAKEMGTKPAQQMEGYDSWYLEVEEDGLAGTLTFMVEGDLAMLYLEAGATDKYEDQIDLIWHSLKSANTKEQALLATLDR